MAIKVRLASRRKRGRIDATELVTRRAEALKAHLSQSILDGVSPVDGSPRPRKGDGKPLHFRTGRLGRKLRLGRLRKSRARAQISILLPHGQPTDEFRVTHVEKHDDVMTAAGRGQAVMAEATTEYIEELQER